MTRNKHRREQKTRQRHVLMLSELTFFFFLELQVILKSLRVDDLQTHPGLSVGQTQLKVQQGFRVDTQL